MHRLTQIENVSVMHTHTQTHKIDKVINTAITDKSKLQYFVPIIPLILTLDLVPVNKTPFADTVFELVSSEFLSIPMLQNKGNTVYAATSSLCAGCTAFSH